METQQEHNHPEVLACQTGCPRYVRVIKTLKLYEINLVPHPRDHEINVQDGRCTICGMGIVISLDEKNG